MSPEEDIVNLRIKRLDKDLPLPKYAYSGDAGLDLFSSIDVTIEPLTREIIPTGIAIEIPEGFAGFVQPRSGLAVRSGLSIVNTPGLIDSHYRGEIKIVAINTDSHTAIEITRGERCAQLVIQRVPVVNLVEVEELSETDRGTHGFGSSGTK
jgi:dUTP pyrophosphatase